MPRKKKASVKRRSVTIPGDLIPKIEERAKRERRGFGNMVEVILFEHFEDKRKAKEELERMQRGMKEGQNPEEVKKVTAPNINKQTEKDFPADWEDEKPAPKKGKKSDDKVTFD